MDPLIPFPEHAVALLTEEPPTIRPTRPVDVLVPPTPLAAAAASAAAPAAAAAAATEEPLGPPE